MSRAIARQQNWDKLKNLIQQKIQEDVDSYWREKISSLIMQGDFMSLLLEEDNCISWKSFIWSVPRGVAKFSINAGLNTLPSADNLKRWGKRTSDLCTICDLNRKQTLSHILSYCGSALEQGRYTWRHNSVLRTIYDFISPSLKADFELFADLEGLGAGNGGTIPPDILVTNQRPDLFLVNRQLRKVVLFELTVPWDSNIESSHDLKVRKYSPLVNDLSVAFNVEVFCFEVSVRGQLTKVNKARVKSFLWQISGQRRPSAVKLIANISKAALLSSFSIFSARNEPMWSVGRDLSVNI